MNEPRRCGSCGRLIRTECPECESILGAFARARERMGLAVRSERDPRGRPRKTDARRNRNARQPKPTGAL